MLWIAECVEFFRFLHVGEFTVPSPSGYDKETHLNLYNLAIDSRSNPSLIRVRIKQSKTDLFRKGRHLCRANNMPSEGSLAIPSSMAVNPRPRFKASNGHTSHSVHTGDAYAQSPPGRRSECSSIQQAQFLHRWGNNSCQVQH